MKNIIKLYAKLVLTMAFLSVITTAQSGGTFEITQSVIASGGGASSGSGFTIEGTTGQTLAGNALAGGQFAAASGFWHFTPAPPVVVGYEADVAPRPSGDGMIQSNDVVQVRRFLNTADTPDVMSNEFQRADSAPFATRGDGLIQSNDVVQARRYLTMADPPQEAGGPTSPINNAESGTARAEAKNQDEINDPEGTMRRLHVEDAITSPGQEVTVNVRVDAVGDESEYGLAVNYNPLILTNPTVGTGTAGAAIRDCFVNPSGRLNCSVGAFPNNNPASSNTGIGEIGAGNNQILIPVTFTVASDAPSGTTPVTLTNVNASNDAAQSLMIGSTNGTVTILGPTAAQVSVSGRVLGGFGRGLPRAWVRLTNSGGETLTAVTNHFGYFRFEGIPSGEIYVVEVRHKRFQFAPQVITVNEEINNLQFTALP